MSAKRKVSRQKNARYIRSGAGQALVEGVAILIVIVAISVGLIFFLLDLGATLAYQQKVTYLATQGALYYSCQVDGWQYQNPGDPGNIDVNAFVGGLAGAMGMSGVTASAGTATGNITPVTVTAANQPLAVGPAYLPGSITVSQTFAATPDILPRPTGLLSITVQGQPAGRPAGTNPTVLVPCYSGLGQSDIVGNRSQGDQYDPYIPGPGMYDQFSFYANYPAAAMDYTPGNRGFTP